MNLSNNLIKLSGDASFRRFYRDKNKKNTIIVFAEKEKKINLLIYDAINKMLIKNKIKAPKLVSQNYKKNIIEIEDLGELTVFKKLKKIKDNKINYYYKAVKLLSKLQKIRKKNLTTFNQSKYSIPKYTNNKLFNESKLFLDWYVPKFISIKNRKKVNKKIKLILKKLLQNLECKKNVLVHRDFHVSNMMIHNKQIAIIDNQDAVFGNASYDLASLIDDVRLTISSKDKKKIFDKYLKINKSIDKSKFKNDFEILSVFRNLKIIGIFTRLSIRDKKNQYLKLIPAAWRLIEYRINGNKKFLELKKILDRYFSNKIRKKNEN